MRRRANSPWGKQLPLEWKRSLAFSVGIFDLHGAVLFANRGMRALLELSQGNADPASYFQAPPFARFAEAAESDAPVFRGLLTIGSAQSPGVSLRGRAFHRNGQVLVVCEHDAPALTRANLELASLLEEVSNLQRELLKEKRALTDANRAQRRLEEELRRALQMRDEVLGIVAHDLRNPLSTIIVQASIMQASALVQGGPEPERRGQLAAESISRAANRMKHLIQDLLDVAQVEAGGLRVQRAEESARDLVLEAVDTQRSLADSAALKLEIDLERELPTVWCDRNRLLQVFENLIGNAIKFTPPSGRIEVGAGRREKEVLFWVSDTGCGIPPESQDHVFDRFWQATRHGGRPGVGLGLPITRGIVEAHGGRIWVDSTVGRGTTFFFAIPGTNSPDKSTAAIP
jgi:signal transduction histidine kinase